MTQIFKVVCRIGPNSSSRQYVLPIRRKHYTINLSQDFVLSIHSVARQEVRQISRNDGDIASMECLLNHLEISNHPQKWQRLVDALEQNGWRNSESVFS